MVYLADVARCFPAEFRIPAPHIRQAVEIGVNSGESAVAGIAGQSVGSQRRVSGFGVAAVGVGAVIDGQLGGFLLIDVDHSKGAVAVARYAPFAAFGRLVGRELERVVGAGHVDVFAPCVLEHEVVARSRHRDGLVGTVGERDDAVGHCDCARIHVAVALRLAGRLAERIILAVDAEAGKHVFAFAGKAGHLGVACVALGKCVEVSVVDGAHRHVLDFDGRGHRSAAGVADGHVHFLAHELGEVEAGRVNIVPRAAGRIVAALKQRPGGVGLPAADARLDVGESIADGHHVALGGRGDGVAQDGRNLARGGGRKEVGLDLAAPHRSVVVGIERVRAYRSEIRHIVRLAGQQIVGHRNLGAFVGRGEELRHVGRDEHCGIVFGGEALVGADGPEHRRVGVAVGNGEGDVGRVLSQGRIVRSRQRDQDVGLDVGGRGARLEAVEVIVIVFAGRGRHEHRCCERLDYIFVHCHDVL